MLGHHVISALCRSPEAFTAKLQQTAILQTSATSYTHAHTHTKCFNGYMPGGAIEKASSHRGSSLFFLDLFCVTDRAFFLTDFHIHTNLYRLTPGFQHNVAVSVTVSVKTVSIPAVSYVVAVARQTQEAGRRVFRASRRSSRRPGYGCYGKTEK